MLQQLKNILNSVTDYENPMDEKFEAPLSLMSYISSESITVDKLPDETIQWMNPVSLLRFLSPSMEFLTDVKEHVEVQTYPKFCDQPSPQAPQLKKKVSRLPVMIPRHMRAGTMAANDCNTRAVVPVRNPAKNTANKCNTRAVVPVKNPAKNTANECNTRAVVPARNPAKNTANECNTRAVVPVRNPAKNTANECNTRAVVPVRNPAKNTANKCNTRAVVPVRNPAKNTANECNTRAVVPMRNPAKNTANECNTRAVVPVRNPAKNKANNCSARALVPVRNPAKNTANDVYARAVKPVRNPAKKTANDCRRPTASKKEVELKAPMKPVERMSLVFTLLSTDDWDSKLQAMIQIQALARHHSETLKPRLSRVCSRLTVELENVCPTVVCSAANTLREMYVTLKKGMDPQAELTGQALLIKMRENKNTTIHWEVNAALDALVQNCSFNHIVSTLLNTGLNHRSVSVRQSTAQHLHQLADRVGADHLMAAGRDLTERVLRAVAKMSVDTAKGVRNHGQMMLKELARHRRFRQQWIKFVPQSDRHPLEKILTNMAANDSTSPDKQTLIDPENEGDNDSSDQSPINYRDEHPEGNPAENTANDCNTRAVEPVGNPAENTADDYNTRDVVPVKNPAENTSNDCHIRAVVPVRNPAENTANDCNTRAVEPVRNPVENTANDYNTRVVVPVKNPAENTANDCHTRAVVPVRNPAENTANDCHTRAVVPVRNPAENTANGCNTRAVVPVKNPAKNTANDCNARAVVAVRKPTKNTANGCNARGVVPVRNPAKNTANDCRRPTASKKEVELKPLINPVEGMSLVFTLLSTDDWKKKIQGMETIQALTRHHSKILMPNLNEVCIILATMVKSLRSQVSSCAFNTLREMYVTFQKGMDSQAELTGQALLQTLATSSNKFIHEKVNTALDALVQNCSYNRIVSALLNTGLNHRSVTVRQSTAHHLHQLADRVGADHMMAAGRDLTERVLRAVAKMSVDAEKGVRDPGRMILGELALHNSFQKLWDMTVPERDRFQLGKIITKLKTQKLTRAMCP